MIRQFLQFILIVLITACCYSAQAQISLWSVHENYDTSDYKHILAPPQGSQNSVESAKSACENHVLRMQLKGFPGFALRKFVQNKDTVLAYFDVGPQLSWKQVRQGNLKPELLAELSFPVEHFNDVPFHPGKYYAFAQKIIEHYENSGYPFVSVKLDSIEYDNADKTVSAAFFVDQGRFFKMDTLDIRGNGDLRTNFLYNYLGFKPGDPYSEAIVSEVDNKLNKLPFIKLNSGSKVYFLYDKAHMVLDLGKRKTDRIDGIVGFAPNSDATDQQQILLTGEVNVDLKNLMGSAKAFNLHWKSFNQRSQELKIGTNLPYLWNKPVGIDGFGYLYKYDTLTINVRSGLGVQYLFGGTNFLRFYYENSLSILQTVDTNKIRIAAALPVTNPIKMNTYGMDLRIDKLDYNINPRKGYSLQLKFGVGAKEIEKDSRIEALQFSNAQNQTYSLYDSIDTKIFTGSFEYAISYFIPIAKKSTLVPRVQGKHIESDRIFFDELYRIGGNNDLRGFDERIIRASSYHLYNLEYRYLISRNSYFSGFVNGAYYQNYSEGNKESDTPFGFGVGVNLEVSSGILRMAFALGQQKGNPIAFNQAKIHFGIVSYL